MNTEINIQEELMQLYLILWHNTEVKISLASVLVFLRWIFLYTLLFKCFSFWETQKGAYRGVSHSQRPRPEMKHKSQELNLGLLPGGSIHPSCITAIVFRSLHREASQLWHAHTNMRQECNYSKYPVSP